MPSAGEPKGLDPIPLMTDEDKQQAPLLRAKYEQERTDYMEAIGQPLGEYTRKGRPR